MLLRQGAKEAHAPYPLRPQSCTLRVLPRQNMHSCRACMPTTCMFCLRTGGMLNKPLLSLTRARSRPALRRFERHVSTLSLMIEQPPPPDKRIVRPPCRVSPDLPGVQRQSDLTAQPRGSPLDAVRLVHATTGHRGADGLSWSSGAVCPRAATWAGPGTNIMQGEASERRSDARHIIRPIRYRV